MRNNNPFTAQTPMNKHRLVRITAELSAVIAAVTIILCSMIDFDRFDIRVPISYSGDATFTVMVCNNAITDGWYWRSDRLGMPVGQRMYDFPNFDPTSLLIMKILGLFFSSSDIVYNLYMFATFFLAALTAYCVARLENLSVYASFLAAMIFILSPFKIGFLFIFITNIYVIPLVTWMILDMVRHRPAHTARALAFRWAVYGVISMLAGFSSAYYVFFSCFFLAIAALYLIIHETAPHKMRLLLKPAVCMFIIASCFGITMLPSLIFVSEHGRNPVVAHRQPFESEEYALTMTKLLLPSPKTHIPALKQFARSYDSTSILPWNESNHSRLGIVGGVGLLILLASLFMQKGNDRTMHTLYFLGICTVVGLLWSTAGGFHAIFSYLVTAKLRCPCRISAFITFFTFFAAGIGLDFILCKTRRLGRLFYHLLAVCLIAYSLYLYTKVDYLGNSHFIEGRLETKQFAETIEKRLQPNSMVYQLPFVPFPENMPVHDMPDYEQAKLSFYSDTLRWSYGSMRARDDLIHEKVSTMPIPEFLHTIIALGFKGVVVYRHGYHDQGEEIITHLSKIIAHEPIESSNGSMVFFDLQSPQLQEKLASITPPDIFYSWKDGVYAREHDATDYWRWARKSATLSVVNYTGNPLAIRISFDFISTNDDDSASLRIHTATTDRTIKNQRGFARLNETIYIPPGLSTIEFEFDGNRFPAPKDSRALYFCIKNFALQTAE